MNDGDEVSGPTLEVPLKADVLTLVIGPLQRVLMVDDVRTPGHVIDTLLMVVETLRTELAEFEQEVFGG